MVREAGALLREVVLIEERLVAVPWLVIWMLVGYPSGPFTPGFTMRHSAGACLSIMPSDSTRAVREVVTQRLLRGCAGGSRFFVN